MSALLTSLGASLRTVRRGLRAQAFLLLLPVALASWALAYQYKTTYTVDVGGLTDDAFVNGFNAKEHNPTLNYRWSRGSSTILLPGIGNEPVQLSITTVGYRPVGPPPQITVEARGHAFQVQSHAEPHTDTFFLDRGARRDSDLRVVISSPVFSPAGDERRLGVIVDKLVVTPADYGLRPLVIPALDTLLASLLALVCLYISVLITTRSLRFALGSASLLVLSATALLVFSRPEFGLLAWELPSLGGWAMLLAFAGRAVMDVLDEGGNIRHGRFVAAAGSVAFVLAFLLRFGGLTYPQFLTSDLGLHIHNLQSVLRGEWLFTEPLPDGTPVPYPPALYVIDAPLTWLLGSSDEAIALTLKWSTALLDAAACLGLALVGSRLWSGMTGGVAALVYALSPAAFDLFSKGNYTNLFAQSLFVLTVLVALVFLRRASERPATAWLAALVGGFSLTVLGHYGMALATVGVIGLYSLWTGVQAVQGGVPRRAWLLIATFAIAVVLGVLLYYWHFTAEIWSQLSAALGRLGGQGAAPVAGGSAQVASGENFIQALTRKASELLGALPLCCALFGSILVFRRKPVMRPLLAAWLLAGLVFALLDQRLGDTIRWQYLVAAPVALMAGRFLGLLSSKGAASRVLVGLSLCAMLVYLLNFWVGELIFTRYH